MIPDLLSGAFASGVVAGSIVGGFVGCGMMAARHLRRLGRIEGKYEARVRALTLEAAEEAQYAFGTEREQASRDKLTKLYAEIDNFNER